MLGDGWEDGRRWLACTLVAHNGDSAEASRGREINGSFHPLADTMMAALSHGGVVVVIAVGERRAWRARTSRGVLTLQMSLHHLCNMIQ